MATLKHMYADMPRTPFLSGLGGEGRYSATLTITDEFLAEGAIWAFFKVPADTLVKGAFLTSDELDDGSALRVAIVSFNEDGTGELTHLAANAVSSTGGQANAGAALPRLPGTQDYYVGVKVTTAATTPKEGEATLSLEFTRTRG